jgi:aryl-alcohol dehydrogenase-like predicted oxidoreductase
MKKTQFGKTGEELSEIGFGGASISGEGGGYGFGPITEAESIQLLDFAYDQGLNLFDTAPIYGFRESEKRMGKAFKNKRQDLFIVSKGGIDWHDNKRVNLDNSPETLRKMLENSLRDLQTDYIDFYMIHWPDPRVPIIESYTELLKFKKEGKVRYVGLSNPAIEDWEQFQGEVEIVQGEYSLLNQSAEDWIFPKCQVEGVGHFSWGTLGKGIITGSVHEKREYHKDDARKNAPWWDKKEVKKQVDAMEKVLELIKGEGFSGLELALSHNLQHPNCSVSLCGARSKDQLMGLLKAYSNPLPNELVLEAKTLYQKTWENL